MRDISRWQFSNGISGRKVHDVFKDFFTHCQMFRFSNVNGLDPIRAIEIENKIRTLHFSLQKLEKKGVPPVTELSFEEFKKHFPNKHHDATFALHRACKAMNYRVLFTAPPQK